MTLEPPAVVAQCPRPQRPWSSRDARVRATCCCALGKPPESTVKRWQWFVASLAWLSGCFASGPMDEEEVSLSGQEQALTPLEQEVQQAFDDAACYCEAYLFET